MIKLNKGIAPTQLQRNSAKWTQALLSKLASGQNPTANERTHYRHPDIKAALISETNGKCAYCESRLQHIHHGDVEHIYPKSLDPNLTFAWHNLTLACEVCNQNKSDKDPYAEHIIDPYSVDPEEHLLFIGPLIFDRGTIEGRATKVILKLHRAHLTEVRQEHVEKTMGVYSVICDASVSLVVRQALLEDLVTRGTSACTEYAAMTKCIVMAMAPNLPADMQTNSYA